MKKDKKSPLKDKPLRHAGQLLDEEINRIIDEDATVMSLEDVQLVTNHLSRYIRSLEK